MAQWRMKPRFSKPRTNNVTFELKGGAGALLIDKSMGKPTKLGYNAGGMVGYTYQYDIKYGIHTGLGFTYLSSGYTTPSTVSIYLDESHQIPLVNSMGSKQSDYDIRSRTSSVDETYTTLMIEIPVQWAYAYENYWFNAGVRLSLPLSISADYTYGPSVREMIYMEGSGTDLTNTPIHLFDVPAKTGSYKAYSLSDGLKVFVNLAIEGGYRIPRGNNGSIYIGLYLDYALNNAGTVVEGQFLEWKLDENNNHDNDEAVYNGVLRSEAVDTYKNFNAGVKLYYNLAFGKKVR